MSNDSAAPFRAFFDATECVPASGAKVTIGWENELPPDTMGITVRLDSDSDRALRSKIQTIELARIKQEHPPIDFHGYVLILDRSYAEVSQEAYYTLVPVKMPKLGPVIEGTVTTEPPIPLDTATDVVEREVARRISDAFPSHIQRESLPADYVDVDVKISALSRWRARCVQVAKTGEGLLDWERKPRVIDGILACVEHEISPSALEGLWQMGVTCGSLGGSDPEYARGVAIAAAMLREELTLTGPQRR